MTLRLGDTLIAGSGANQDLSNLTSTGQNIANWSSNVSNCITEIPQDIKLELNNGTLTLKAGSKVYVPKGFEQDGTTPRFDVVTIESDIIYNTVTNTTGRSLFFLYPNLVISAFTAADDATINYYFSGPTVPTVTLTYALWYDTTNNLVKYTHDNGTTWISGCSLPLSICSYTNGIGVTSIDQVFNGFGYIGSTVYVLPNVKGLIPNGRNTDGSLKNTEFTTSSVLVNTYSSANGSFVLRINNGTTINATASVIYNEDENFIYISGTVYPSVVIGKVVYSSGKITSFIPKTPFHALDYNDSSTISGWSMPSSRYDDLTLGASGASYAAPANGYISMVMSGTISGNMGYFSQLYDNGVEIRRFGEQSTSGAYHVFALNFEIKKGQTFTLSYYGTTPNFFRFIYAEGEQ